MPIASVFPTTSSLSSSLLLPSGGDFLGLLPSSRPCQYPSLVAHTSSKFFLNLEQRCFGNLTKQTTVAKDVDEVYLKG